MWTKSFWLESMDRAIKSAAQAVVLIWGVAEGFNLFEADFINVGGLALGAFALSLLTSVVSAPLNNKGSASLIEAGS